MGGGSGMRGRGVVVGEDDGEVRGRVGRRGLL